MALALACTASVAAYAIFGDGGPAAAVDAATKSESDCATWKLY